MTAAFVENEHDFARDLEDSVVLLRVMSEAVLDGSVMPMSPEQLALIYIIRHVDAVSTKLCGAVLGGGDAS